MPQTYQARLVRDPDIIQYTPSSAVSAGDVVVDNGLLMIAREDVAASALGAFAVDGIFDVVKVNGALSIGAVVYWDADGNPQGGTAGTGGATSTSTSNTPIGRVVEVAAGTTDEFVRVKLFNSPSVTNTTTSVGPLTNEITDPGDAGAIPVTTSGTCMLASAGAETRTIADPAFLGEEIMLTDDVHVGNIVVTAASPVNQTGNNTLTFGAAGDTIHLIAIERAGALEWHVDSNDGVALSTV